METFKKNWDIQQNWQLIFPLLGLVGLLYSSFKLANALIKDMHILIVLALTAILFIVLLKFTLFLFKKLEKKWDVNYKWELIRIFIVFAITGTSSLFVGKPIIKLLGITKENLNIVVYWVLYIIIGLIFYQILLLCIGWLFGQFKFFWEFEKKMLRRMGFKRFLD
ncbi:hypothetical protein D778_01092 [Xanthomarina gelatinilytica]|uniref:DUF6787 domain-containing protein n=1 Tax=Xanthomarina gelatinilytica TaxID=1137281 RepID=M7MGW7_9FLAO|nr:DUF6787 family protein [Xanthomarina gelatinilytica]EMQ94080.1 hypothetical protein D778_01092 [Xanthomarina gelatinilytica]MCB0389572.1 hypothetical protein [Winogradskyella sp.]